MTKQEFVSGLAKNMVYKCSHPYRSFGWWPVCGRIAVSLSGTRFTDVRAEPITPEECRNVLLRAWFALDAVSVPVDNDRLLPAYKRKLETEFANFVYKQEYLNVPDFGSVRDFTIEKFIEH